MFAMLAGSADISQTFHTSTVPSPLAISGEPPLSIRCDQLTL